MVQFYGTALAISNSQAVNGGVTNIYDENGKNTDTRNGIISQNDALFINLLPESYDARSGARSVFLINLSQWKGDEDFTKIINAASVVPDNDNSYYDSYAYVYNDNKAAIFYNTKGDYLRSNISDPIDVIISPTTYKTSVFPFSYDKATNSIIMMKFPTPPTYSLEISAQQITPGGQ